MIGTIAPPGVTRRLLGGVTTAVVPVGATAIPLDLTSDFSAQSGGVLRIEDVGDLVYTGHEDDVVSLAEPLAVELEVDSPVHALDAEGNVQEEWTAAVDLGDGEDDPETCYIGTDLQGDLQEGEEQVDQSVEVVERDGRYWIAARTDQQRSLDSSTILTPSIRLHLPAAQSIANTTWTPLVGWETDWSAGFFAPRVDGFVRLNRSGIWRVDAFVQWQSLTDNGSRALRIEWLDFGGTIRTKREPIYIGPAETGYATSFLSESYMDIEGNWFRISVRQSSGASLSVQPDATTFTITWEAAA